MKTRIPGSKFDALKQPPAGFLPLFFGIFLAAALAACFNPLDYPLSTGDNGLISVDLSGPAKTALTTISKSGLSYELSFSGPGGQSITRTVQWGETCVVEVPPGPWTVAVKAKDGSAVIKAIGETVVDVQAGSRTSADVKLAVYTEVSTWSELKAAIQADTPGDSGGYADEFIVITGSFNASNTITLSHNKTVTIAVTTSDTTFTIGREGTFGTSFLNIVGGHLILGSSSPAYGGTLTLDGTGSVVVGPIVTMTSLASFTMNSGTLSTNNITISANGGAVFAAGTFTMNGGEISGNSAVSGNGGGVYVTGTFTMNGPALVASNNDVYLAGGTTITITGPLTQSAAVTVTLPGDVTAGTQILTPGFPAGSTGKILFTDPMHSLDSAGKLVIGTPATVSMRSLDGKVTAPARGAAPVTTGIDTAEYTGTVAWQNDDGTSFSGSTFAPGTVYKAVVALTAKAGYTFNGVGANSFSYTGATNVTHPMGSNANLTVTIVFPATALTAVTVLDLTGAFAAPATGGTPATSLTGTTQYTGSITWSSSPVTFAGGTAYTATVTLTAATGYTFAGVEVDDFTYTSASVTNPAGSGPTLVVTIVFPATALDWSYIDNMITSASGPTIITITSDITVTSTINLLSGKEITIKSDGNWKLVRASTFTNEFFNMTGASLTLQADSGKTITLDGDSFSSSRPLIYMNSGTLTLGAGSILEKNYNSTQGGAVYALGGSVVINGGVIRNNKTTNAGNGYGGGLAISGVSDFSMSAGSIYGNQSAGNGGGLNLYNTTTAAITGGSIYGNQAGANGGGICVDTTSLTLSNFYLGIDSSNPTTTTNGNSATTNGGGIMLVKGTITMNSGFIMYNATEKWGGGVCVGNASVNNNVTFSMNGGHICKNRVTGTGINEGGGVYLTQESNAVFDGSSASDAEIKENKNASNVASNVEHAAIGTTYTRGNVKVGGEGGESDTCTWVP
ncbi:MAG: hypothetical protein LBG26_03710 [Treponema sp.]|jgi:hypothetical protein|nr:hypothetical protein [Treponema sp.]